MLISRRAVNASLLAFICAPFLSGRAAGQQSGSDLSSDLIKIKTVIRSQLAAFPKGDAEAAFGFASPKIQRLFGDAANFMQMVRQQYATIYDAKQVFFQEILIGPAGPVQPVSIIDSRGRSVIARYQMQRQTDGSWRINGVTVLPVKSQGI